MIPSVEFFVLSPVAQRIHAIVFGSSFSEVGCARSEFFFEGKNWGEVEALAKKWFTLKFLELQINSTF
jgi:hypothetical protein